MYIVQTSVLVTDVYIINLGPSAIDVRSTNLSPTTIDVDVGSVISKVLKRRLLYREKRKIQVLKLSLNTRIASRSPFLDNLIFSKNKVRNCRFPKTELERCWLGNVQTRS